MNTPRANKFPPSLLGVLIALLALGAYLLTLSPVFYPGASSQHVAQQLGLTPFPALTNGIWGWLISVVASLPFASLPVRLNALSALCAAGALYVFFQLVLDLRLGKRPDASEQRVPAGPVSLMAASVAMVFLATCIPLWIVATRAHPLAFDLLLGLLPFRLVQWAGRRRSNLGYYLAALVYGLSVTEYSTMIALGPLLALCMLVGLLRQGRFTVGAVFGLLAALLLGLTPYLLAAWHYMQTPAYAWREFTGFWLVLKYIWLEQWATLTRSLPRVGWLTMGFLTVVPWAIAHALHLIQRPHSSGSRRGQALIHVLIAAILLAVFWDFPFSPWRSTRGQPLILIPYVFAALGLGLSTAFLVDLLGQRGRNRGFSARGYAVGAILVPLALVSAIRHLPETNGRSAAVAVEHLEHILKDVGPRSWLLTSGQADAELALLIHQAGAKLTLINPRTSSIDAYQNYLASLFEEPRLQGLARVSLAALLKEWLVMPGVLDEVAVMDAPDLWEAMDYQAVPEGLIYTGEPNDVRRDPTGLVSNFLHMAAGHGQRILLASQGDARAPIMPWLKQAVRNLARQANNLGVYAEDQGRSDLAALLYREAVRLHTNNISALINLTALAEREKLEDLPALAAHLEELVQQQEGSYSLWSLSQVHGYVRSPENFASRGWAWAMSGKPGLAVREIKRAIRAGGDTPAAQLALAQMYFDQQDDVASEETYRKLLAVNPEHAPALLGLVRLAARQGDFAEARRNLIRLRQLDVAPEALNLEEAVIEALAGDHAKAAKLLADVIKRQPDNSRAWMTLAVVASQQGDTKKAEEAVAKLQAMRNLPPQLRLALAQIALAKKDTEGARRLLEDVLRSQPGHVGALLLMVRIQQAAGNQDLMEAYLNRLLTADPGHAYGNFLLGTLQFIREQNALAEASFRASLAARRAPETLNAIAYLLYLKGNLEEAEPLVREALKSDEDQVNALDTLANILVRQGKLDEAERTLQKALALQPQATSLRSSLVRLYDAQGRGAEAVKLADELLLKSSELTPADAQLLRALLKRLRGSV
jgi:Tfp pilus assembly protein PilF